jgi:hydroxymethylpyrimidine/phosphomethylpyrimidine kinase
VRAALTIAGSDSSAGAGIQADLKTFAALDVYGASVVTAVTSQNTRGVSDVVLLAASQVRSQIESVVQDLQISAIKTGMLGSAEIVTAVADAIGRLDQPKLVVDPVTAPSNPSTRTLLAPDAVSILKSRLFPLALVVTPNIAETAALSGIEITSLQSAREGAKRIFDLGPRAVVVKGGHLLGSEAIDTLYDGRTFTEFSAPRWTGEPVHGTGCTFASALAAGLALGDDLTAGVQRAKAYVSGAIEHSFQIGKGSRVLDHFWMVRLKPDTTYR